MGQTEEKERRKELEWTEKPSDGKKIFKYLLMTAACFCYAIGISLFLDPNDLAPGGVTGIAIILNRTLGISTGILFFAINIPILLIGMWKFGIRFLLSTVYCTVLVSLFTDFLGKLGAVTADPLLAALAGSVLMAVGMGGVFKAGATTGGTDIIVKLLRLKFPYMKTGFFFLVMDTVIVTASALVFKDVDRALYAGISVFITSFTLDLVLYGRDGAKLIYIISDASQTITERLLKELDIGVTHVQGKGAYSGKEKQVILCVMRKALAPRAEEIVKQEDPLAFMIVSNATEIYGEGYKSYFSEKL